jgi:hypothetical protein
MAATGIMIEGVRALTADDPSITGSNLSTPASTDWNYTSSTAEHSHTSMALLSYFNELGIKLHIKGYSGAVEPLTTIFAKMGLHLNEDARGILAAAEISYINELLESHLDIANQSTWRPASWINRVAKIFGYNSNNLEERIEDYIEQMASLLPKTTLHPCRLAQGQVLALKTLDESGLVFFDCAGINIITGMAEGILFAPTKPCSTLHIPPNTCLTCIEGSIRLGVTGNYSIMNTELQRRYVGRAIAVDYTPRSNGVSYYKIIHIHQMDIDFNTVYTKQNNNTEWIGRYK